MWWSGLTIFLESESRMKTLRMIQQLTPLSGLKKPKIEQKKRLTPWLLPTSWSGRNKNEVNISCVMGKANCWRCKKNMSDGFSLSERCTSCLRIYLALLKTMDPPIKFQLWTNYLSSILSKTFFCIEMNCFKQFLVTRIAAWVPSSWLVLPCGLHLWWGPLGWCRRRMCAVGPLGHGMQSETYSSSRLFKQTP